MIVLIICLLAGTTLVSTLWVIGIDNTKDIKSEDTEWP